jgi:predicted lipoprotein
MRKTTHQTALNVIGALCINVMLLAGCSSSSSTSASPPKAAGSAVPIVLPGETVLSGATVLSGTLVPTETTADRGAVVADLASGVMIPAFENLATSADGLVAAVTTLCVGSGTRTTDRTAAKQAWEATRGAFRFTDSMRIEPATELVLQSGVDFPIDATKVDVLLGEPAPVTSEALGLLGADVRGLRGIEHVLFAPAQLADRQCEYLVAASSIVSNRAGRMLAVWKPGAVEPARGDKSAFLYDLMNPSADGFSRTHQQTIDVIVNRMLSSVAEVQVKRLGLVSGKRNGTIDAAAADPGLAESATASCIDMLKGVRSLLDGQKLGISSLVTVVNADTVTALRDALGTAITELEMLPVPLGKASPDQVLLAEESLEEAQTIIQAEVMSQLGITLLFGDADGDG